ncbi:MAG TPA: hypothetical protein VHF51_17535 [Solirubrobacteraceae bacterium]|nr:hypothetical protein [Solirubrobacteraceae bacterium]
MAENADVGGTSEKAGSEIFAALEADAEKFGWAPVAVCLPDDLAPVPRAVMEDFARVAGVRVVHDGDDALSEGVPYSQRWRADVLGISHTSIGKALRTLVRLGLLTDRGETGPQRGYPRGTKLYGLGPRALEGEAPTVEAVADGELEPEPPDQPSVGDAELGEVAMPGEFTASAGGASGHAADARRPRGAQCAIFDDDW